MEFTTSDFIWTVINFTVFIAILSIVLYKPILGMMVRRQTEIEQNLSRAEESNREAEALRQQYLAEVQRARREAQEIVNQATRSAQEARDQILAEARQQSAEVMERTQAAIEREKQKAIAELRDEVATLAVMAAGKLLQRELREDDHTRLVRDFVAQVGEGE